MDYQLLVDNFPKIASILSVDILPEGGYGEIKIISANDGYKRSVVSDPADFVSDVPYTQYIKKDINFESMCTKCAIESVPVHAYVDAAYYNAWMEIYMMPLVSDSKDRGLCLFSYSMSPKADADKMVDVSAENAIHILKTCIKLRETTDFQSAMDSIIRDIRILCDSPACCILLTNFKDRTCSVLCEDTNDPNRIPMKTYVETLDFFDIVETWPRLIDGSNCFIIQNEEDMRHTEKIAPEWAKSLKGANVSRLVIYPLRSNDETIGYIWAINFDASKTLKIKETLEVTTFILSSEIANHQMVKMMKILSSTDLLTGVYNRNAMNNRISDAVSGEVPIPKPFGVFFVDVNGLKTVNDTKGHIAGDNLLKEVACTLKDIFPDDEIYRVGGDEFLVIAFDDSEDNIRQREKELISRKDLPGHAKYAVGSCYSDEHDEIRKAMQLSDARMYDDKREFYRNHPEIEWDRKLIR